MQGVLVKQFPVKLNAPTRPLGSGGAGGAQHPLQIFLMLFYINNDDKLWAFFTRHVFFFISFIVSFSRYFYLQITILNSPTAFMHLAKVAQNWHTSDQSGIWAMPCGPLPNSEICYEKELPTLKGYLLEIRKVSPKPYFILMTAFTLSVEYARFINTVLFCFVFTVMRLRMFNHMHRPPIGLRKDGFTIIIFY